MDTALTGPRGAGNGPRRGFDPRGGVYTLPGASFTVRGLRLPRHEVKAIRPPAEAPLPSAGRMAVGLVKAAARTVAAAVRGERVIADESESARRHAVCRANRCGLYRASDDRCASCGCWMRAKPWIQALTCPRGWW